MIFITGDTHGPVPIGLHSVDGFGRRFNKETFPEQKEGRIKVCSYSVYIEHRAAGKAAKEPSIPDRLYYRGYTADVSYDPQDGIYVGTVDDVPDILGFHADTLEELPLHFRACIDDYIKIITRYKRGS